MSAGCPVPTRAGGCCERGRGPRRLWCGGGLPTPPTPTVYPMEPKPGFSLISQAQSTVSLPRPRTPLRGPGPKAQNPPSPHSPRSILTTPTLMPSGLPVPVSFVQPWKGPHPLQGLRHAPCPLTLSAWLWSWHPSYSPCPTSCSSSGADGGPKGLT